MFVQETARVKVHEVWSQTSECTGTLNAVRQPTPEPPAQKRRSATLSSLNAMTSIRARTDARASTRAHRISQTTPDAPQPADLRLRRHHLDHEIRGAPDTIRYDPDSTVRDKDDVRLHDKIAVAVEDDVDRRDPYASEAVLLQVGPCAEDPPTTH
jgi:hypothetical protein